jgi:hypothetical protein
MKSAFVKIPKTNSSSLTIKTNGVCFQNFIKDVEKNISKEQAVKTQKDSIEIVQSCIRIIEGTNGKSGTNSLKGIKLLPPKNIINSDSTMLIYGRVQSGKTNSAIGTLALALENGFKIFVYLTSDNLWLLDQTERRIQGALQDSKLTIFRKDEWSRDPKKTAQIRVNPYIGSQAFLFFCNKHDTTLKKLLTLLSNCKSYAYPSIILDDEADNASLNTSTRRQITNPSVKDSGVSSTIKAIRKRLNNVFLQVTATPQSLFLQHMNHPDKPSITKLLEPGRDYMGGELFFQSNHQHTNTTISLQEVDDIKSGSPRNPDGLEMAFLSFCVAYSHCALKKIHKSGIYSFLAHICHRIPSQTALEKAIEKIKLNIYKTLRGKNVKKKLILIKKIKQSYNDLKRTSKLLPFKEILPQIQNSISSLSVIQINSTNKMREPNYKNGMNVLVGGNKLSRGVTIEGLTTSYYGRSIQSPQGPQSDTMQQHARMFGYRGHLKSVTRLFVPQPLFDHFLSINDSEDENRNSIENLVRNKNHIVWIGRGLRPTRANVYDPRPHSIVVGGVQMWPRYPTWRKRAVQSHNFKLSKLLRQFTPGKNFKVVRIEEMLRILKEMPSAKQKQDKNYNLNAIEKILRKLINSNQGASYGLINYRKQGNTVLTNKEPWSRGFISGKNWAAEARKQQTKKPHMPVLIVYRINGSKTKGGWDGVPIHLPTLWLPQNRLMAIYS